MSYRIDGNQIIDRLTRITIGTIQDESHTPYLQDMFDAPDYEGAFKDTAGTLKDVSKNLADTITELERYATDKVLLSIMADLCAERDRLAELADEIQESPKVYAQCKNGGL